MLEKLNLDRKKQFQEFKISELGERFARLQRICESLEIPILIIVDGWESSGKGYIINELVRELNPKYFDVDVFERSSEEDLKYPFMRKFWIYIPKKGHVKVFDRSFYYEIMDNIEIKDEDLKKKIDSIKGIEKTLYDDKTIIIKYFLNISEDEQRSRIEELKNSELRSFYVDIHDIDQNNNYEAYRKHFDRVLELTNFRHTPWTILDANNRKQAAREALGVALEEVQKGIERVAIQREAGVRLKRNYDRDEKILQKLNLNKSVTIEEYDNTIEELQNKASDMILKYFNYHIPIVLVFEGVDAAGKDGAIGRLIKYVDPRIYKVHAISAPDEGENARNYLWRFYTKLPKDGNVAIFSRSWYGRVMVERVEGFAKPQEWERAYDEMLEMERQIYDHGGLVIKFFVTIDKDTQLLRFEDREIEPNKQFKITDEDWRNREKWDQYVEAMNEMLDRTNVDYAPWVIVEGNDKRFARIKVIKEFLRLAEEHLDKLQKNKKGD